MAYTAMSPTLGLYRLPKFSNTRDRAETWQIKKQPIRNHNTSITQTIAPEGALQLPQENLPAHAVVEYVELAKLAGILASAATRLAGALQAAPVTDEPVTAEPLIWHRRNAVAKRSRNGAKSFTARRATHRPPPGRSATRRTATPARRRRRRTIPIYFYE